MTARRILIIGAGPTGLSAAVECARHGLDVTVLERNSSTTDESRAVGVNRQSLLLLAPSGVAKSIAEKQTRFEAARFMDGSRQIARLKLPVLKSDPPAMVLLAQSETERALVDGLSKYGVSPVWNTAVEHVEQTEQDATAILSTGERITADYILGADGSHSLVRKSLGLTFPGTQYPETWSLLDAEIDWPWPDEQAVARVEKDGAVTLVIAIGGGRYRAISNRPDVGAALASQFKAHKVIWENAFTVSLRAVEQFGEGRVWIAGDAAHIHSPVGGMGMNLGIEDACDFASCMASSNPQAALAGYQSRRRQAAVRTLRVSDRGYRFITSRHWPVQKLRNLIIRIFAHSPFLRDQIGRVVMRTDAPSLHVGR